MIINKSVEEPGSKATYKLFWFALCLFLCLSRVTFFQKIIGLHFSEKKFNGKFTIFYYAVSRPSILYFVRCSNGVDIPTRSLFGTKDGNLTRTATSCIRTTAGTERNGERVENSRA